MEDGSVYSPEPETDANVAGVNAQALLGMLDREVSLAEDARDLARRFEQVQGDYLASWEAAR